MAKKEELRVVRISTAPGESFFIELMDTTTQLERWLRLGFNGFPTFESARDWVREKGFILVNGTKPFVYQAPLEQVKSKTKTKRLKVRWLVAGALLLLFLLVSTANTSWPNIQYVPADVAQPTN